MRTIWSMAMACILGSCAGDGGDHGGRGESSAGQGAGSDALGSGGSGGVDCFDCDDDGFVHPTSCDLPSDPIPNACLSCLASRCCSGLLNGRADQTGGGWTFYNYQSNFRCVQRCFEAEVEAGSRADSSDIALACAPRPDCSESSPPQVTQELVQCAFGIGRSEADAGTDDDAGFDDDCTDACFPR